MASRTCWRSAARSWMRSWPSVRAVAMRRSRLWRSSWRASSSSLAGVASSWPARMTSSATRRASGSSPAGSSPAGERRRPRRYSAARRVSGAEKRSSRSAAARRASPSSGQREAVGEEGALGLLAAIQHRARAVRRRRRRRRGVRERPAAGEQRRADEVLAEPEPAGDELDELLAQHARRERADRGRRGLQRLVAPVSRRVPPPSSAISTSKRASGTARSSSERIASAPSCCTTSAGSLPDGQADDPEVERRGPGCGCSARARRWCRA